MLLEKRWRSVTNIRIRFWTRGQIHKCNKLSELNKRVERPKEFGQVTWTHWILCGVWKWCESWVMVLTMTRSEPNQISKGDFGATCSTAPSTASSQYQNLFWSDAVLPSCRVLDMANICDKEHWILIIHLTVCFFFKCFIPLYCRQTLLPPGV